MSKPPIDTKKIWRLCCSVARASMTLATARSWFARLEFIPANGPVIAAEPVPVRIGLILALAFCATMAFTCDAPTMALASPAASSSARAAARSYATLPGSAARLSPVNPKPPPVGSASVRTCTPVPKVWVPENDIDIGVAVGGFMPATLSPTRPPQPLMPVSVEACRIDDMPCCCWSLWENRFDGFGTRFDRYSARVIGRVRLPALTTTASLPTLKSPCSDGLALTVVNAGLRP